MADPLLVGVVDVVPLGVADTLVVADSLLDVEALSEPLRDTLSVCVPLALADAVRLADPVNVADALLLAVPLVLSDSLTDSEAVAVPLSDSDDDSECVLDSLSDCDSDADPVGETDPVPVPESVVVNVVVPEDDVVREPEDEVESVHDALRDPDFETEDEGDAVRDAVFVPDSEIDCDALTVIVFDKLAELVAEIVSVRERVGEDDMVSEAVLLEESLTLCENDCETVDVPVGDPVKLCEGLELPVLEPVEL